PTSGKISLSGQDISGMSDDDLTGLRRDRIGFIFQQFNLIPLLSAVENVEFPLTLTIGREESRRRAIEVMRAVHLDDALFTHRPAELSGGEQQRVAIARALVNNPDLLLCDEPTGNLDRKTGTAIMEILEAENREGKTVIVVTHDPEVATYARRTIRIVDGKVV
ncbi:MAG TPA: ABC transporter ATP-binding protein, partial [Methanoculleus sp.]|nr:ABC transporter ATP-binding protein [Methanoculleus sp.]